MKIAFLNALQEGGAARAAMRLLKGMRQKEVDVRMIVQHKTYNDPCVIGPSAGRENMISTAAPVLEWLCVGLYALRRGCMFSPALVPDRLPSRTAQFEPDIVHLHWVTNGFMRVETVGRFDLPVVWTLHDSWAFTGGCHIPAQCLRYYESCGKCPVLGSSLSFDLSRRVWKRKQKAWRGVNLTIVAPSRWMGECAQASSLLRDVRIEVIPNCIDTGRYRPVDRRVARENLSLPQGKKLIIFGGKKCIEDRNKGFLVLVEALRKLAARGWRDRAEVIVLGSQAPSRPPEVGMKISYLGWLGDEDNVALLNAAADVCVVPSFQESLSYAAMESLACGTPCVAFDQGGVPDVIDHGRTGYLAHPYDPDDLAHGIEWVLGDDERRRDLSFQARVKAEEQFAAERVAERHAELYREIIDSARNERQPGAGLRETPGKKKGAGESPLVSVITVTYNSAKHLHETIESVIGQDYPNVEYIIVDGGSTDGTLEIIKSYEGKIQRWISERDRGIGDAMNKGIRMASGEVVGIIHSDDYYADSTVLRRVVEVFGDHPEIGALYGIQDYVDPVTGKTLLTWGRDADPSEIKKSMYIPHPTLFVRREVYDAIGLFRLDYKVAMDYEFALRLTKHTRPHFLNYKISCMRDMGTSGVKYRQSFREVVRALATHGYYFAAFLSLMRSSLKQILIWLGFKGLIIRLWKRNVSPR